MAHVVKLRREKVQKTQGERSYLILIPRVPSCLIIFRKANVNVQKRWSTSTDASQVYPTRLRNPRQLTKRRRYRRRRRLEGKVVT